MGAFTAAWQSFLALLLSVGFFSSLDAVILRKTYHSFKKKYIREGQKQGALLLKSSERKSWRRVLLQLRGSPFFFAVCWIFWQSRWLPLSERGKFGCLLECCVVVGRRGDKSAFGWPESPLKINFGISLLYDFVVTISLQL